MKSDRAVLIICIGIALIFWTLTRLSQKYQTTQECLLEYDLPEGYILASEAPKKLLVTMEGVGWDLMTNYFYKEEGVLKLSLSTQPRQIYNSNQIINKLSRTKSKIEIDRLNIDLLDLTVEKELRKSVPIILSSSLNFNSSYQLKKAPVLTPDSIVISGPENHIAEIIEWPTQLLELANIDKNMSLRLPLLKPSRGNISLDLETVQLELEVEQLTEKDFFIFVQVKNAPDSIKIFPENIKIRCAVGLSSYDQITPEDFVLEVDMEGIAIKGDNNTLPVLISKQPSSVRTVHLSHQSVEFFFVENAIDTLQ
ncbi:MAG: hypothetical protein AB8F74_00835 [Saprospiraceae bacterium]